MSHSNMHHDNDLLLSEFAEYLLKNRLVPEPNAPYYVRWVRRFLATPDAPAVSLEERLAAFLHALAPQAQDWQVTQAERAVKLYFTNFLKDTDWRQTRAAPLPVAADGTFSLKQALASMRDMLRVRHYAYRTEQSYLEWVGRFFTYLERVGAVTASDFGRITAQDIKNFLAQLAIREHIAPSTQNQALCALLFLCREVLSLELGDLEHTVRAREGRHLPVVLSVDEVRTVFDHLKGTPRLMAELIYGGGLRVMECCRLRVKDLDYANQLLFVRAGKGDRVEGLAACRG